MMSPNLPTALKGLKSMSTTITRTVGALSSSPGQNQIPTSEYLFSSQSMTMKMVYASIIDKTYLIQGFDKQFYNVYTYLIIKQYVRDPDQNIDLQYPLNQLVDSYCVPQLVELQKLRNTHRSRKIFPNLFASLLLCCTTLRFDHVGHIRSYRLYSRLAICLYCIHLHLHCMSNMLSLSGCDQQRLTPIDLTSEGKFM